MNEWLKFGSGLALSAVVFAVVACGQGSLATPTTSGEGRSGSIAGTVSDAGGRPIAGMRVGIVSGSAGFPEIAPETNEQGRYQVGRIAPGTYEVAVHDRQGKRVVLESVNVRSGAASRLDFTVSAGTSSSEQRQIPPPGDPAIFFPRQEPVEGDRETMAAMLFGELVVANGCLHVSAPCPDRSYLVIWPPDFTLSIDDDGIQVPQRG